jgi:nucleoside-diphosphate-sugar epimerase
MDRGHEVVGLDTGFYRDGWLYNYGMHAHPSCINKDIRHMQSEALTGYDAIVHLAELSNDPLGQLSPEITYQINYRGTTQLAQHCKRSGIRRFIYTSSCSVYGAGASDHCTEQTPPNPQTAYAKCKVLVERELQSLADETFSPVVLRNATAYGPSPRMRFDLVLNNLVAWAVTTGKILMKSDGSPWRPIVHIEDISRAFVAVLEAPREAVHNQIFNVGRNEENYRVREIAEIVAAAFPGTTATYGPPTADGRSYRVSFDKINRLVPGFTCRRTAATGAAELREVFERIGMTPEVFQFRGFTRLTQLQHLLATGQMDDNFFMRAEQAA